MQLVSTGSDVLDPVAEAVREGFAKWPRSLPPWLFYDARGSALFEAITELPEYYLTRAERSILETSADEIVAQVAGPLAGPLRLIELGAGTAIKTDLLLQALGHRQGPCIYVPIDVSESAIHLATERIRAEQPEVDVRPMLGRLDDVLQNVEPFLGRSLVLFLGSSIGNLDDGEASELLGMVAAAVSSGSALLLGADRKKDAATLLRAYDDSAGVTAEFNLNMLGRLNRELGTDFHLENWHHVAVWNEARSRMEMHLESEGAQEVLVPALGRTYRFHAGERIHTESSVKYEPARIESILAGTGFQLERTWTDADERFDLHLARRA